MIINSENIKTVFLRWTWKNWLNWIFYRIVERDKIKYYLLSDVMSISISKYVSITAKSSSIFTDGDTYYDKCWVGGQ